MTRNGSETDSGMTRNSSDSLGMNFNPILSPGYYATAHTFIYLIQRKKNNLEISLNQRNFSLTSSNTQIYLLQSHFFQSKKLSSGQIKTLLKNVSVTEFPLT